MITLPRPTREVVHQPTREVVRRHERRHRALVLSRPSLACVGARSWHCESLTLSRAGTVRVARKFAELQDGRRVAGPPKSSAGVRTVALPAVLIQVVREHLAEHPAAGDDLIFRGPLGAPCGGTTSTGRSTGPTSS